MDALLNILPEESQLDDKSAGIELRIVTGPNLIRFSPECRESPITPRGDRHPLAFHNPLTNNLA